MFTSYEKTRFIIPDVEVENRDGNMIVTMNQHAMPRISIRQEYNDMLREQNKNSKVVDFLMTCFNSAKWLT